MFQTISDIIGLWFVWSVREGNYYKAPAKLTIGRNLVEILRGGRRLLLAHLMSSWEAICQIFTTVGGQRTKETFVKGQTNVFSGQIWKQWDWWKTWWKQWKEKCFAAKLHQEIWLVIAFLRFVIYILYRLFEQAIWSLG